MDAYRAKREKIFTRFEFTKSVILYHANSKSTQQHLITSSRYIHRCFELPHCATQIKIGDQLTLYNRLRLLISPSAEMV